jgi:hypothetical protein
MPTTDASPRLAEFRQEVYRRVLGHRQDSLLEIIDALLTAEGGARQGFADRGRAASRSDSAAMTLSFACTIVTGTPPRAWPRSPG